MSVVKVEFQGDLAIITIDNPPVNALSQSVRSGIVAVMEEVDGNSEAKAAVLFCAGRTFCAGADIREFDSPPKPPHLSEVIARVEASDKPVVAALHGTALGGGFELSMGCHYRVALPSARVGLPEVTLGLLPGAAGTQRLPRLIGAEQALDMMVTGKPISAVAADAAGILDKLIEGGDLLTGAIAYATELVAEGQSVRRVRDLEVAPVSPEFFDEYRKKSERRTRGLMSPEKIIQSVRASIEMPFDEAAAQERAFFAECKVSSQSNALRHVFFSERAVTKVPGISQDASPRDIASVAVIGAGTMGAGIAYSCLGAGLEVTLLDNDAAGLARGRETITSLYEHGVSRGRVTESNMLEGLTRLTTTQDYDAVADLDLVIEAVFETMAIKEGVFARLDEVCRPGAILATNTSTLDVDRSAAATQRPGDVIGLHFFSPAHLMPLLEIVRGAGTEDAVIATSLVLAKRLRKIGVVVGNCFGFVGNRMLYGYGRESQLLLLEGAAPEQVDKALQDWGMAMGPHAVGDLAGLDVGYKVRQEREDLPEDPRFYRIANLLAELGRYGQKTGKGMYLYESGSRKPIPDPEVRSLIAREAGALGIEQREIGADEIVERCIYALIVEGARILEEGISPRASDIDVVWINGYGFPRYRGGPMHYADAVGLDRVYETVSGFRDRFGPMYWEVPKLLEELGTSGGRFADL